MNSSAGDESPQECQAALVDALGLFLSGSIDREELHDRTLENLRQRHLFPLESDLAPVALTALGLTALLTSPDLNAGSEQLRRGLQRMSGAAGCRRPLPVGELLRLAAAAHGPLELAVQKPPVQNGSEKPMQWVDLALENPSAGFRLIPVSVFTRTFFHEEVLRSAGTDQGADLSRYHRENDKAPTLKKQHPELAEHPRFEYFVDEAGLSEIVLDSRHLGCGELLLASRLFAFYSGLEDLNLEGIPITGCR
ncbi:MAG: hypothetical protein VX254_00620 [Planctomycetota bacterium]|nr:hypothetical protein [Planctomycetota bacterium]